MPKLRFKLWANCPFRYCCLHPGGFARVKLYREGSSVQGIRNVLIFGWRISVFTLFDAESPEEKFGEEYEKD